MSADIRRLFRQFAVYLVNSPRIGGSAKFRLWLPPLAPALHSRPVRRTPQVPYCLSSNAGEGDLGVAPYFLLTCTGIVFLPFSKLFFRSRLLPINRSQVPANVIDTIALASYTN